MPNLLPAPEEINAEEVGEGYGLADRVADLEKEIATLRSEMETDRRQTATLFRSVRVVFGTGPVSSAPSTESPAESDKWERIKAKVGGKMAAVIEALQLTGTATRTQLKNQTGGALTTIDTAVYKLRDMGLLVKNGDGWTLKP